MAKDIPSEADAERLEISRRVLAHALLASLMAMLVIPPLMQFQVDYRSFWGVAVLAGVPAAFVPYAAWRKMAALRSILELATLSILLSLPTLVFSYAAMRFNMPMADVKLMAMDAALGFDWPEFVRLVDRSPFAATLLQHGYSSFALQLLFLPMLLCIAGLRARAHQLMLAFLLLCIAASLVSIPFPSMGAYVAYGLDGQTLRNINAHFGYFFLEPFAAVRGQEDFVLSSGNGAGIITFPSVHAGVAVLAAWAAWASRWLRYPFLFLNMLMFVSAVTHGAHYLVDVVAGGGVAALAIAMSLGLTRTSMRAGRGWRGASRPAGVTGLLTPS